MPDVLFFLFFPRIQGPLWALPQAAGGGVSGLSDEMSPGSLSSLSLSDAVAFRVEFSTPPPAEMSSASIVKPRTRFSPLASIVARNKFCSRTEVEGPSFRSTKGFEPTFRRASDAQSFSSQM